MPGPETHASTNSSADAKAGTSGFATDAAAIAGQHACSIVHT